VRALVLYTTSRMALFLVALVVVTLLGAPGLVALALALLISGAASFFLLSGQRDALSAALAERAARTRARLDDAAASEDDLAGEESSGEDDRAQR
jgi:hypothetical protein